MLMKCGHQSQGNEVNSNKPICLICMCEELATDQEPNLEGRMAKCTMCHNTTKSNKNLPFFEYREILEEDSYYCGCQGWD